MKDVVLHSDARVELEDAVAFYEERREGLGVDFLAEVERAFERIQQNPKQGTLYRAESNYADSTRYLTAV